MCLPVDVETVLHFTILKKKKRFDRLIFKTLTGRPLSVRWSNNICIASASRDMNKKSAIKILLEHSRKKIFVKSGNNNVGQVM